MWPGAADWCLEHLQALEQPLNLHPLLGAAAGEYVNPAFSSLMYTQKDESCGGGKKRGYCGTEQNTSLSLMDSNLVPQKLHRPPQGKGSML